MVSTASADSADHMSRTQASSRNDVLSPATVVKVREESDTVKVLTLRVQDKNFTFKAGQWVDTYIPGVKTVGGFSMCSSPTLLQTKDILVLAIKFSKHPPAYWAHTKCKPGDTLLLRVGGDFFFDPQSEESSAKDILLIAGGVGINPLYSMVNHVADINALPSGPYNGKALLLYSARTCSEHIFKDQLKHLSASHANITCRFFATRESEVPDFVKAGRIDRDDIVKAVRELRAEKLQVYMCGPSPMIEDMEKHCVSCHITKQQIFCERWW